MSSEKSIADVVDTVRQGLDLARTASDLLQSAGGRRTPRTDRLERVVAGLCTRLRDFELAHDALRERIQRLERERGQLAARVSTLEKAREGT